MDWIKHDSNEPPALAQAALVSIGWDQGQLGPTQHGGICTVQNAPWSQVGMYRQLTDPEDVPYCSAEGLAEDTKYVATNEDVVAMQYTNKPFLNAFFGWMLDANTWTEYAPNTHRHPGDWNDSLMRVWRGE